MKGLGLACLVLAGAGILVACNSGGSPCGPSHARVARVLDGDTIELDDGTLIRYLLVNTPEIAHNSTEVDECYAKAAADYNRSLVEGRDVRLTYDASSCTGHFDRTLAYVWVGDINVNRRLVERGYACVDYFPPSGKAQLDDFKAVQSDAQHSQPPKGMWGQCSKPEYQSLQNKVCF